MPGPSHFNSSVSGVVNHDRPTASTPCAADQTLPAPARRTQPASATCSTRKTAPGDTSGASSPLLGVPISQARLESPTAHGRTGVATRHRLQRSTGTSPRQTAKRDPHLGARATTRNAAIRINSSILFKAFLFKAFTRFHRKYVFSSDCSRPHTDGSCPHARNSFALFLNSFGFRIRSRAVELACARLFVFCIGCHKLDCFRAKLAFQFHFVGHQVCGVACLTVLAADDVLSGEIRKKRTWVFEGLRVAGLQMVGMRRSRERSYPRLLVRLGA
jgi:hypothetical protein